MAEMGLPVALIILDGWGLRETEEGNAIKQGKTPNMDHWWEKYPHTTIQSAGLGVGLPEGQMGNSEVGHLNLGAGRVVYQNYTLINKALEDGSFFSNEGLLKAVNFSRENDGALHLMGLLSDGGVHSHIEHLYGLLELARRHDQSEVYVHAFLDGRDVPPANALEYIEAVKEKFNEYGVGEFGTIMGRYYAMDRDNRWDRTEKAYVALTEGRGLSTRTAEEAIKESYRRDDNDEFVVPTVLLDGNGEPRTKVSDGDGIIFYNFRPDRARQLTRAFTDPCGEFDGFEREEHPDICLVCMTEYDETIDTPVAFRQDDPEKTLGRVLAGENRRQLRIAETEKYAHVTFFFSGGREEPFDCEERILVPSPKVATYDQKPEMSAYEVTDRVVEEISDGDYDVIILNYANADMVGHTGFMDAAVSAIEAVDECLGRTVEAVKQAGGVALITADHGNAEQMIEPNTGEPHTAHTSNPSPFILISPDQKIRGTLKLREGGRLADVAPTILDLLEMDKPEEMTGTSLISAR